MPVSYTHLDVYKRQDQGGLAAAGCADNSQGLAPHEPETDIGQIHFFIVIRETYVPKLHAGRLFGGRRYRLGLQGMYLFFRGKIQYFLNSFGGGAALGIHHKNSVDRQNGV